MSDSLVFNLESLTVAAITSSPEIQAWLSQFQEDRQVTAMMMLSRLRFVSRDVYSAWLRSVIAALPTNEVHALYSVRKLDDGVTTLWNDSGAVVNRSGTSLGSEDLVYSLISNVVRSHSKMLLDHPSLNELHDKKVHSIILIDDSIGSGDRVAGFINAMLNSPTFLSWWSFGLIKMSVISFARPRESESKIIAQVRGSDHGMRKFRKSTKISFTSELVYHTDGLESRWGGQYMQVLDLCKTQTKVAKWARFGYGEVMANTVFYHSVPNNIPGVIWFQNDRWKGLFPGRALPDWLPQLLAQQKNENQSTGTYIPPEIRQLLKFIKRGVRNATSLATRLGCDHKFALALLERARELGLLSDHNRLTMVALDLLSRGEPVEVLPEWDRSLYIPSSWCVGRATAQPPVSVELAQMTSADSVEVSTCADGDVGETFLERSDAKAATPPFSIVLHPPSVSRENHDTDGPLGSKER